MAAYLLSWNPELWPWHDLDQVVDLCNRGEVVTDSWSCGNTKRIVPGDRLFFIRVGSEPRGIFACGTAISSSYEDTHWKDKNKTGQFVKYQLDAIANPEAGPIIPRSRLNEEPFASVNWSSQNSGISIPDHVATVLQEEWSRLFFGDDFSLPDEVPPSSTFTEGARQLVTINSYERNIDARNACIAHYGTRCIICEFAFADKYGPTGNGLIHIHHLTPIAKIGHQYKLDPITDLQPVCPNCHAIIHRRNPPYTINDVRGMIRNATGGWAKGVRPL